MRITLVPAAQAINWLLIQTIFTLHNIRPDYPTDTETPDEDNAEDRHHSVTKNPFSSYISCVTSRAESLKQAQQAQHKNET